MQFSKVNLTGDEPSFHFFTQKITILAPKKIYVDFTGELTRLMLISASNFAGVAWYDLCNYIYVHVAGIGGGTTCPYEQLTPISPTVI